MECDLPRAELKRRKKLYKYLVIVLKNSQKENEILFLFLTRQQQPHSNKSENSNLIVDNCSKNTILDSSTSLDTSSISVGYTTDPRSLKNTSLSCPGGYKVTKIVTKNDHQRQEVEVEADKDMEAVKNQRPSTSGAGTGTGGGPGQSTDTGGGSGKFKNSNILKNRNNSSNSDENQGDNSNNLNLNNSSNNNSPPSCSGGGGGPSNAAGGGPNNSSTSPGANNNGHFISLFCCPCRFNCSCLFRSSAPRNPSLQGPNLGQIGAGPGDGPPKIVKKSSFKRFSTKLNSSSGGGKKGSLKDKDKDLTVFQLILSELDEPENQMPTVAQIVEFSVNFDLLMSSLVGRKLFREFLKSEYSEENILFWMAVEELKKFQNVPNSAKEVEEKAKEIYEDFISILSPKEVSLDSRVRECIDRRMISPSVEIFDVAQHETYLLMARDSFPRFVNSVIYKSFLADLEEKSNTTI